MHKKISKILIIIFVVVFVLQLAGIIYLWLIPLEINAADINFKPQVGIGDFKTVEQGGPKEGYKVSGDTSMIGNYIIAIYKYAIGVVGILAAVVMMLGGVLWLIAGGNAERVSNAKSWIVAAVTGLVLALSSYMILALVNPDLVNFKITDIGSVKEIKTSTTNIGCCACTSTNCPSDSSFTKCHDKTNKTECDEIDASSSSYTWTSYKQSCDNYPSICLQ